MRVLLALLVTCGPAAARMINLHREEASSAPRSDYTYCDSPTTKAKVEFPSSLAGRVNQSAFDSFSGYVNVTAEDWLYYWFFEATEAAPEDAVLTLWTNGGPGCTAMEAATTEHGPWNLYRIKESTELATGQLSENPQAWNNYGPVLYVDQPRYVGNSFGYGPKVTSSVEAAQDIVTFILGWYEIFPEYATRPLVIAGESYGGHYIPAWASAIMDYNEAAPDAPIPLSGIAIGNGCVNDTVQGTDALVDFMHENNLISADSSPRTQATAWVEMREHLGYTPNYYDFRVRNVECSEACYSYNYTTWSLWFIQDEVMDAMNVCGEAGFDAFAGSAGGCIDLPGFDAGDTFDYSEALARALDADIPVLFYYGKNDLACNYVGAYAMASSLPWSGKEGFESAEMTPLGESGGSLRAGEMKQYGPLIWTQIEAAGHMVPLDEPEAAADAFSILIDKVMANRAAARD